MQRSSAQKEEAATATAAATGETSESNMSNVSGTAAAAGGEEKPSTVVRKFHNGWNKQLEALVAEWADKASCYQWMHQKTEVRFQNYNYYFTIPVIIMSTLTGTANFATDSVVETPEHKKLVTFGIGAISLIAGIISTVANFLRYAQSSEAHRVAAVSWGKFQRFISIELSLHPNERMDAMSFLKMGRVELDRLIEQSPPIPSKTIRQFLISFKDKKDITRPEIAGGIEHTRVFEDRDGRLAKIAAEAVYTIQQKKGLMRQLVLEDIDKRIVSRAREERVEMEDELRREIMTTAQEMAREVAREATLTALRNPSIPYAQKMAGTQGTYANPRQEVADVIPPGVVEKVTRKIARRMSLERGAGGAAPVPFSIAEAAAAIGAARQSVRFPGPIAPKASAAPMVDTPMVTPVASPMPTPMSTSRQPTTIPTPRSPSSVRIEIVERDSPIEDLEDKKEL
jgi:hypothetical protein